MTTSARQDSEERVDSAYSRPTACFEELRCWITDCGYHCAGQSVPAHVCDPLLARRIADGLGIDTVIAEVLPATRRRRSQLQQSGRKVAMVADGVFEPSLGLERRPEVAALSMSGSSFIVAVNALTLKRAHLPAHRDARRSEPSAPASGSTRSTS